MEMKRKVIQALLIVLLIIAAISISCGQLSQEAPIPPPSAIPTPPTEAPIVTPTTGQNGWSSPTNISNTTGELQFAGGSPSWLLHDKNGNLTFVWMEVRLDLYGRWATEYLFTSQKDGVWSETASLLSDLAVDEDVGEHEIGVKWKGNRGQVSDFFIDQDDDLHLFWMKKPRPNAFSSQVIWSTRAASGEWAEPILIFDNPDGGDVGLASIVVDNQKTMHVIIEEASAKNPWIFYLTRSTEGGWSKPERLSFVAHTSQWPVSSLVIDKEDTLHLAWRDYDQRKWLYATKPKGAEWREPTEITPGEIKSDRGFVKFSMKMDNEENLHFIWSRPYDYSGERSYKQDIFWAVKPKNGEMSKSINISKAYSEHASYPCFAIDQHDALHVVWCETNEIMYASRVRDDVWSEPVSISAGLYSQEGEGEVSVARVEVEIPEAIYVNGSGVHVFWTGLVIKRGKVNQEIFYSFKPIGTER